MVSYRDENHFQKMGRHFGREKKGAGVKIGGKRDLAFPELPRFVPLEKCGKKGRKGSGIDFGGGMESEIEKMRKKETVAFSFPGVI